MSFEEIRDAIMENDLEAVERLIEENRGIAGALNVGLHYSKSEWVFRMDADDIMLPERIQLQMDYLKENPSMKIDKFQQKFRITTGGKTRRRRRSKKTIRRKSRRNRKSKRSKR